VTVDAGVEAKEPWERTATEILMSVLDDFAENEGRRVVVIWTNDAEEIVLTTNARRPEAIGLCRWGEAKALGTL
jgi:hypothetical protein